jgi:hypothetical protein
MHHKYMKNPGDWYQMIIRLLNSFGAKLGNFAALLQF